MAKKTTELFTPYTERAALAEPRPPRVVRVYPVTSYGGTTLYYMNSLPFPVPAWTRHLDERSVGSVLAAVALALLALGAAAWAAWRLFFGTRR